MFRLEKLHYPFSDHSNYSVVYTQTHNQKISIFPINAMGQIHIVLRFTSHFANKFHDFVLPFTRYKVARNNDFLILPKTILASHFTVKVIVQVLIQLSHERCSWCYGIGIKCLLGLEQLNMPCKYYKNWKIKLFCTYCFTKRALFPWFCILSNLFFLCLSNFAFIGTPSIAKKIILVGFTNLIIPCKNNNFTLNCNKY